MKRFQNRQIASPEQTPRVSTDTSPAEPALPSIAEIKTEAEQKLLARRTEKLNLFLEYTHLVLGPYISAKGLVGFETALHGMPMKRHCPRI